MNHRLECTLSAMEGVQMKHRHTIATYSSDAKELKSKSSYYETKYKQLSSELDKTTEQLVQTKDKLAKYKTRNVTKRQKRLQTKCEQSQTLIKSQNEEISCITKQLEDSVKKRKS